MAKQSKDDLIKLLTDAGVELTGEEKVKDLVALAEEHDLISKEDGDEDEKDDVDAPSTVKKGNVTNVHFALNDKAVPSRDFNAEEHGDNFLELADEFAVTHQNKILSRVDS